MELAFLYFVSCDLSFNSFISLQIIKILKLPNIVFYILPSRHCSQNLYVGETVEIGMMPTK